MTSERPFIRFFTSLLRDFAAKDAALRAKDKWMPVEWVEEEDTSGASFSYAFSCRAS